MENEASRKRVEKRSILWQLMSHREVLCTCMHLHFYTLQKARGIIVKLEHLMNSEIIARDRKFLVTS